MKYKNIYQVDKNSIRREVMEFLIIGSKYGKIFNLIGIIFIISSFISMYNNPKYSIYFFVALLLFVINIVRIYKKAVYFSKKLEDKTLKRVITIDGCAISEKVYDSEKIIKDVSFQINEVDYVGNGIKNIFIFGGSDIKETAPYGNNAKIITANLSCSPCRGKCKFDKEKCLEQIKPDDVFESIKEWIK